MLLGKYYVYGMIKKMSQGILEWSQHIFVHIFSMRIYILLSRDIRTNSYLCNLLFTEQRKDKKKILKTFNFQFSSSSEWEAGPVSTSTYSRFHVSEWQVQMPWGFTRSHIHTVDAYQLIIFFLGTKRLGTRLVCDPAYIVGRITLVRLGLVK